MSAAPSSELECRELVELVTDYLEGALPIRTLRRVRRHLAGCADCTSYIRQVEAVVRTAGTLGGESLPPRVRQALLHLFRHWRRRSPNV